MLAEAVFEETEETTKCAGCGAPVEVEDWNYFTQDEACPSGHWVGESGYYCDSCFPQCPCQISDD